MKKVILLLSLAFFTLFLGSCKDSPTVTSVTVSGQASFIFGESKTEAERTFTADVKGKNDPAQTVTWTTDVVAVATINENGVLEILTAGVVNITATSTVDKTIKGSLVVTITDPIKDAVRKLAGLLSGLPQVDKIDHTNYEATKIILEKIQAILNDYVETENEDVFEEFVSELTETNLDDLIERVKDTATAIEKNAQEVANINIIKEAARELVILFPQLPEVSQINHENYEGARSVLEEIQAIFNVIDELKSVEMFIQFVSELMEKNITETAALVFNLVIKMETIEGAMANVNDKAENLDDLLSELLEFSEIDHTNYERVETILGQIQKIVNEFVETNFEEIFEELLVTLTEKSLDELNLIIKNTQDAIDDAKESGDVEDTAKKLVVLLSQLSLQLNF